MNFKPYRPENPQKGDLIFHGDGFINIEKPEEMEKRAGVIVERMAPNHRGVLFNYNIMVRMASGETIKSNSRDWRCLRMALAQAENFVVAEKKLIKKLESLSPKKEEPGPSL